VSTVDPACHTVRPLALVSMLVVTFVAGRAKADADVPAGVVVL